MEDILYKDYGMKILFVCSANICRSALCEVVLKQKLMEKEISGVDVESAGLYEYVGDAGDLRDATMQAYAQKAGYDLKGKAKLISQEMLVSTDYFICMDHFHVVEVQKRLPYVRWNRIRLFNEICFGERTDLPDPSGDTGYMYAYVLQCVEEGCSTIAWKISKMINDEDDFF